MRNTAWFSTGIAIAVTLFAGSPALAQDSQEEQEKQRKLEEQYDWSPTWEYELVPYFWFSAIKGDARVQGQDVPIDLGGVDFWNDFNLALSFHFEAQRKKLAGWLAITATDMEQNFTDADGDEGKFRLQILRPEAAAAYRLFAGKKYVFEGYAGFRYTDWKPRVEFTVTVPGEPAAIETRKSWFDPMVGARFRFLIGQHWPVFVRGDIGGFGLGADLAWGAQGGVAYMFSPRLALAGAYRYYYTDYKSDSPPDDFVYDADQQGPLLGVAFLF
jgi:hypothetical protein